jgi:hypothetical protein
MYSVHILPICNQYVHIIINGVAGYTHNVIRIKVVKAIIIVLRKLFF